MTTSRILASVLLFGIADVTNAQTTNRALGKAQALVAIAQDIAGDTAETTATYLGIASSPIPASLREQLKLKRGVGLVVERVEKGSPAEQAGVKQYDIVEKLDDQLLMNGEQFASLVRMQQAGAQVKLSIIRQGQPQTLTATLVEKKRPANALSLQEQLLNDATGKVRVNVPFQDFKFSPPIDFTTRSPKTMTISSAIGSNRMTITRDGDNLHLVASDVNGTTLFDGDVNTEEQWEQVPADIATEARRLLATMKLKLPFRVDTTSNSPTVIQPVPAKVAQPALP